MDFNSSAVNVSEEVIAENALETKPFKRDVVPFRHASVRLCRECGKFYILSDSDVLHFVTKYGSIPLKCEDCRRKAREANPINVLATATGDDCE